MSNKPLPSISFNPEVIKELIANSGLTIKEIAEKLDRTDRSVRRYISKGCAPIHIYNQFISIVKGGWQ